MKVFNRETIDPDCSHICLTGYGDSHLPAPLPSVTHLMLYKCDKNFVYCNTNPRMFPNLKKLWVFAHPCGGGGGYQIQSAFPDTLIYASKEFEQYYSTYSPKKVVFLSAETVKLIMEPLLASCIFSLPPLQAMTQMYCIKMKDKPWYIHYDEEKQAYRIGKGLTGACGFDESNGNGILQNMQGGSAWKLEPLDLSKATCVPAPAPAPFTPHTSS